MNQVERARLARYAGRDLKTMTFGELDDYEQLLRQYLAELEAWRKEKEA